MARARIAARLARKWRAAPQTKVQAVVRTVRDLDDVAPIIEQRGLTIVRRFRLLPAMVVSGTAEDCLALASEEWVTSVEEDQVVHTMNSPEATKDRRSP